MLNRFALAVLLLVTLNTTAQGQDEFSKPPAPLGPFDHVVIPVTEGVWLLQRPDPTRQPVEANITVIAGDDALLVVDTGGTPKAGRDAVTKIQGLSGLPVRWVVNTHWHGDHHLGNPAFRLAWPQVEFIAHSNTARDMTGPAMDYLEGQDVAIQGAIDNLGQLLEGDVDAQGEAMTIETRLRYRGLLTDMQVMLAALGEVTSARENRAGADPTEVNRSGVDRTFNDQLELDLGGRKVQLLHLGRGNTEGDVVAWMPAERILASGDLVVAPTPYGFGSYPAEWIQALNQLKALDYALLIPGHGDPMADTAYLDGLLKMIADFRVQATIAVARGHDLETFRTGLDVSGWQQRFAGEDPRMQRLFQAWWVTPFSQSAWLEAKGLPIVQGDDGN